MTIDFMPEREPENRPRITVFGVGGAGSNAVNNMIAGDLEGVEFVVANTDAQSLFQSLCEHRVRLGVNITQGLGAGASAEIGKVAAEEALDDIQSYLEGNNMVFIAAGMGGGTGTGAAPVIASAAREHGILTVGVVTKPFHFEGSQRMLIAEQGIRELHQFVDTLIVIPNQNLFRVASEETTFADAFGMADDVLHAGVRGVTDLMVNPGLINLDFADIRTVMGTMGKAMMGTGEAEGENRAMNAAEAAINNPLLDNASIEGARGVLINVTGGTDVTLHEVDAAATRICKQVDENATIIFGTSLDQKMDGHMRVSVIATGIDSDEVRAPVPESTDNIHVLGFSERKGTSSGGAMSSAESEKEAVDTVVAPSSAATGTDDSDIVIPVAEAVAESAAAAGNAGTQASSPAPEGSRARNQSPAPATPRPSASPGAQAPAAPEPRARQEQKAVAASAAGGVAARATVAGAAARAERPSARFSAPQARAPEARRPEPRTPEARSPEVRAPEARAPEARRPEARMPERKVAPPVERPALQPRRTETSDVPPPGRPSLFERMTGTGRARRNVPAGEMSPARTEQRASGPAETRPGGQQTSGPKASLSAGARPSSAAAPTLGAGAAKTAPPAPARAPAPPAAAKSPEPFLDGFSPSSKAPGGTEDPLDIPAFLRRQAN